VSDNRLTCLGRREVQNGRFCWVWDGWIKVFGMKSGEASRNRRDDGWGSRVVAARILYLRIGLINWDVRAADS
jgi:hypothetical protein